MVAADRETIRLDIAALALDGLPARFTPAQRQRVAAEFTRELRRLLRVHGLPAAGDLGHHLVVGLPPLPPTASPHRFGQALARAIHSGLSGAAVDGVDSVADPATRAGAHAGTAGFGHPSDGGGAPEGGWRRE